MREKISYQEKEKLVKLANKMIEFYTVNYGQTSLKETVRYSINKKGSIIRTVTFEGDTVKYKDRVSFELLLIVIARHAWSAIDALDDAITALKTDLSDF